jgi:radical SAM protein (TIGR01212 family)
MTPRRYNDFNTYLRKRFGCRVQKITIDAGFFCPNRDGTLCFNGCIYCNGQGSGTGAARTGESIRKQIQQAKARLATRYKARKFIAYFQAFTNTYASCDILHRRYDEALVDSEIVGLAIGTRPDCVDEAKLNLIEEYTATHMVWIEYGLQSIHNRTLETINRRHTFEDFVRAVRMTEGRNILICAHVILGLPGESRADVLDTATALAELSIDGVKIHSLYILRDTPLGRLFEGGGCTAEPGDLRGLGCGVLRTSCAPYYRATSYRRSTSRGPSCPRVGSGKTTDPFPHPKNAAGQRDLAGKTVHAS